MTRVVTLLLIGMVLVLGTCLLDGSEGTGQDLCGVPVLLPLGAGIGRPLGVTGTLAPLPAIQAGLVSLDRPVPPPRT